MAITKLESSRDFFRIWFTWKKPALLSFLLIVGLVMFYAYGATPIFESKAEILVLAKTNEASVISSSLEDRKIMEVQPKDIYTEMELIAKEDVLKETILSLDKEGADLSSKDKGLITLIVTPIRYTFNGILRLFRLKSPPTSELKSQISDLRESISINPIIDSDVITVSLRGERPEKTAAVLEEILKNYLKHRNSIFNKQEGLAFYDDQAETYRKNLAEAEEKLNNFQKEGGIVSLQFQNEANINLITLLTNELRMLEVAYEEGTSKIESLKANINSDSSILQLTKEMRIIPAIVELEKSIVPILIKRSEISKTFTKESREYTGINAQIDMLRDEVRHEIEKAITTDELELESMQIKIDALKNKIAVLGKEASAFKEKEKIHAELEREVEIYKNGYLLFSNKKEDAQMNAQKSNRNLANVTISSVPTIPETPVFPKRFSMLILAIVVGSFVGLCTPFILESIDNKLKTSDDIEALVDLPVICTYPEV